MDFGDHVRTTGGALKKWAIAQVQDSLAVEDYGWVGSTFCMFRWQRCGLSSRRYSRSFRSLGRS